jgi:hypothetical protein
MTVAELQTFAPGFAWQACLGSAVLGNVNQVVVAEKSAFHLYRKLNTRQ